jgi:hypothetical protein
MTLSFAVTLALRYLLVALFLPLGNKSYLDLLAGWRDHHRLRGHNRARLSRRIMRAVASISAR